MDFVCVRKGIRKPATTQRCCPIFPRRPIIEHNDRMGESAPQYPKPAGAEHNVDDSCQPLRGTPRSDAQPAPTWANVDSDIALRRGLGYLHARDAFDARGLPATSTALVDRPASDPSCISATKRGF